MPVETLNFHCDNAVFSAFDSDSVKTLTCPMCALVTAESAKLSAISGISLLTVRCNGKACSHSHSDTSQPIPKKTDTIPISEGSHLLTAVHTKDQLRSLLSDKPNLSSIALVTQRNCYGLKNKLNGVSTLSTFTSDHPLSIAMNHAQHSRPSPVLALLIPADHRKIGECETLATGITESNLKMVFTATLRGCEVRVLFDSGASNSFVGAELLNRVGLTPNRNDSLKSVATACGQETKVIGLTTTRLTFGPIVTEVTLHVLPTFLPNIDIIIGQDFMMDSHVILDYAVGQAVLHKPHRTVLKCGAAAMQTLNESRMQPNHTPEPKPKRSCLGKGPKPAHADLISPRCAAAYMRQGCDSVLIYVKLSKWSLR